MTQTGWLEQTRPTGHGRARGLVSSPESGRRIDARRYGPPEDLTPVVEVFWSGRWDLRGQAPHTTELLGDPCLHVVVESGGAHGGSRVVGVWTRLWTRTLEGQGRVLGVKLRAGAVAAFLPDAAAEYTNKIVPLAALFGQSADRLGSEMLALEDDTAAFDVLADFLRERRRPDEDGRSQLAVRLASRIAEERELTTVEALARRANVSLRFLQRLFHDHVGASPKWVIRRHRLQEAALSIEAGRTTSLAELAAELGYADQAHLGRDFKKVVGKSPSEFRASLEKA